MFWASCPAAPEPPAPSFGRGSVAGRGNRRLARRSDDREVGLPGNVKGWESFSQAVSAWLIVGEQFGLRRLRRRFGLLETQRQAAVSPKLLKREPVPALHIQREETIHVGGRERRFGRPRRRRIAAGAIFSDACRLTRRSCTKPRLPLAKNGKNSAAGPVV